MYVVKIVEYHSDDLLHCRVKNYKYIDFAKKFILDTLKKDDKDSLFKKKSDILIDVKYNFINNLSIEGDYGYIILAENLSNEVGFEIYGMQNSVMTF